MVANEVETDTMYMVLNESDSDVVAVDLSTTQTNAEILIETILFNREDAKLLPGVDPDQGRFARPV